MCRQHTAGAIFFQCSNLDIISVLIHNFYSVARACFFFESLLGSDVQEDVTLLVKISHWSIIEASKSKTQLIALNCQLL